MLYLEIFNKFIIFLIFTGFDCLVLPLSTPMSSVLSSLLFPATQYKVNITNNISNNDSCDSHYQEKKEEFCAFPVNFISSPAFPNRKFQFLNDCTTSDIYKNSNNSSDNTLNCDSHYLFDNVKDFRSNGSNKYYNRNLKEHFNVSLNCMMGNNNTIIIPASHVHPQTHPHTQSQTQTQTHTHSHSPSHLHPHPHPHIEFGVFINTLRGCPDNNSSKSVNNINTKTNKLTVVTENKFFSSENNSVAFKEFDQLCSRTIGPSVEAFKNMQDNISQNESMNNHKNSNIILISNDPIGDRTSNQNQNQNSLSSEASKFLSLLPDYTYLVS